MKNEGNLKTKDDNYLNLFNSLINIADKIDVKELGIGENTFMTGLLAHRTHRPLHEFINEDVPDLP